MHFHILHFKLCLVLTKETRFYFSMFLHNIRQTFGQNDIDSSVHACRALLYCALLHCALLENSDWSHDPL